jgi:hypothetical protein
MNHLAIILTLSLLTANAPAPNFTITPIDFLGGYGPGKMNARSFHKQFGRSFREPASLLGGALLKVDKATCELYLYIFCDPDLNRLVVFRQERTCGERHPAGIKEYGRYICVTYDSAGYTRLNTNRPPLDSEGVLVAPVDIAVSSGGAFYNPYRDFIYVVDQGNHQVVRLRYNVFRDSLIWCDAFGCDSLNFPTAIAYVDYGDSDPGNDDIYVTDPGKHAIIRFSASGEFELSNGGCGYSIADVCYPTGIAVSTSAAYPKRFYVTDSRNHKIIRYYSDTNGQFIAEARYIFPSSLTPFIKSAATDDEGNVYVLDRFNNIVMVLTPSLAYILTTYGGKGHDPGRFECPLDIFIDGDEMLVCEMWGDSAGIASFRIIPDSSIAETGLTPKRSHLYPPCPYHFSDQARFAFDLAASGPVQIIILDKSGRSMRTLLDNNVPAGSHAVIWNGKNDEGKLIESGIYMCNMISADYKAMKPVLYIR